MTALIPKRERFRKYNKFCNEYTKFEILYQGYACITFKLYYYNNRDCTAFVRKWLDICTNLVTLAFRSKRFFKNPFQYNVFGQNPNASIKNPVTQQVSFNNIYRKLFFVVWTAKCLFVLWLSFLKWCICRSYDAKSTLRCNNWYQKWRKLPISFTIFQSIIHWCSMWFITSFVYRVRGPIWEPIWRRSPDKIRWWVG